MTVQILLWTTAIFIFVLLGALVLAMKFFRKVEQGKAMIVNTMRERPIVTFTGRIVLPVIHKAEVMDISVKRIVITRKGHEGLICQDNIRADISVNFFVRVNPTEEDVLHVAGHIGCERASDEQTLDDLFNAKFAEALKTVGKQLQFEELYQERGQFRDAIKQMLDEGLNGYVLEDVAIDYLEQTPIEQLDDKNILDAQGIRKITELTAAQHVAANDARRNEEKSIKKQDVEARETILALERQQADAEARQRREIDTTIAREQAATNLVKEEERLKAEQARIRTEQQLAIDEENKKRETEVAQQERLKLLAVKEEEVLRARELEVVAREQEVEVKRIEKERALEQERREIADVIRERVAVEKTVAAEEEKIKELREVSAADRAKQVRVTAAQAEAEEALVKRIKEAEAEEQAARHQAQKEIALAEAELESSAKHAEAKKVLAEGIQAEEAAKGLAQARVREAQAAADEKYGRAQAEVVREKLLAEAKGQEEKGMAEVRVKEAEAASNQEQGFAEARIEKEKLTALADGEKARGMAKVAVEQAEAEAIERRGQAEAFATRERYTAEAAGLTEKFKALKGLDEAGRLHEEFRLQLEKTRDVETQAIEAQRQLGEHQAAVLAEAFKSADINIVGGDGAFFDRMVNAISGGKSIDALIGNSNVIKNVGGQYLTGEKDIVAEIKELLASTGLDTADLQNLTVSAALMKLMAASNGDQRGKIGNLIERAKELGLQ